MKKIMLFIGAIITTIFTANAQCNKTIKWTCSKQEFLDTAGNHLREQSESVEVTTTPKKISVVRHASEEQTLEGDITDYDCKWKDKQNGKTTFKSLLVDNKENKTRHATITIEAVNGKTTILLQAEEEETMIKLDIDSFEEVK
jgi:hypothetical protein